MIFTGFVRILIARPSIVATNTSVREDMTSVVSWTKKDSILMCYFWLVLTRLALPV